MSKVVLIVIMLLLLQPASQLYGQSITLVAVGDIMLAGSGSPVYKRAGFDYAFAGTKSVLRAADVAIGNLEAPLATGGTEYVGKKFRFKVDPSAAAALRNAGFTVLSLANNHSMDFGAEGLRETVTCLRKNNLVPVGAGMNIMEARLPAILSVKGKRLAFLAYSLTQPVEFFAGQNRAGTAPGFVQIVREDVHRARAVADHVVVSFHWGAECARFPKAYQVNAAHAAVDAGAAVVLGHHPHVLQGVERYRDGIIFYSLGNFAFGSMSRRADVSIMVRINVGPGAPGVEILPIDVLNSRVRFQPALLSGARSQRVISHLQELSGDWNTVIVLKDGRYLVKSSMSGSRIAVR